MDLLPGWKRPMSGDCIGLSFDRSGCRGKLTISMNGVYSAMIECGVAAHDELHFVVTANRPSTVRIILPRMWWRV